MAKEKDCEGIIEDVVLLGAPIEGDPKSWKLITKVVSGRIINGFCRYWGSDPRLWLPLQVNGHLDYMKQMDGILKAVGLKTRQQEQGGLLGILPPSEEEKQGMPPDGPASEGPSGLGRPDVDGAKEGEGLNGHEDSWCWEPVSAPGQECEVSPARVSKEEQPPEILSPSSSSSPS
ncbi:PREDICTED: transmembrane and coiled-coil domain-containing protein 4 [Thamnophis sirtalis]|uniref:Transmembrane and coiled-coil domain-containing protein 4 n=1 Tax=Thamnophis sirtalis TaxID=35019 RepID=A0A6I9Y4K8_9SAUR|nr:PREDICTED: transmembrane and coiled-coil domain-containing protein 4 [Thamnophis sirtalis]